MKPFLVSLRRFWRKYGALILVAAQIIMSLAHTSPHIYGYVIGLYLTIPCGIKWINTNKTYWYIRQAFFLCGAAAFIMY